MSYESLDPVVNKHIKNPVEPYSCRQGTLSNVRGLKEQLSPPTEEVDGVQIQRNTPPSPEEYPKIQAQLKTELDHYKKISPPALDQIPEEDQTHMRKRMGMLANAIRNGKPGGEGMLSRQQHWEPYQENLAKHRSHEHDITRHALDSEGNWVFLPPEKRNSVPSVADEWRDLERTFFQDADREEMGWVGEMSTLCPDQKTSSERPTVSLSGISARDYLNMHEGDMSEMLPGPRRQLEHELKEESQQEPQDELFRCGASTQKGTPCQTSVGGLGQRCKRHQ